MADYQITKRVDFATGSAAAWKGELLLRFAVAVEKPAPGRPGKEVGEIITFQSGASSPAAQQTILVSLGEKDKLTVESLRRTGGAVIRWLMKKEASVAGIDLGSLEGLQVDRPDLALAEGIALGSYRFGRFKSGEETRPPVRITFLTAARQAALQADLDQVQVVASAVHLAREWGHEPANVVNPVSLGERAQWLAGQAGLKCTVLDDAELARMGAGALLSVGKGSRTPSRLIVLEYPGQNTGTDANPVVLVGKAITFDTGGYSIKDTQGIQGMKYDKCGGLAVIAALWAAAQLKLKTPLVG